MMKFVAEYYLKMVQKIATIEFFVEDWEMAWTQAEGYQTEYRKLMNVVEVER